MEDFKNKKRTCPYSGEDFYPKRHNQRFANPRNRIAFHNSTNNELRRARSFVDKKLHKNYTVLLELMKGKAHETFHKQFLYGKGFSFSVMTHYEVHEGKHRQAMYDFIIIPDGHQVTILRKK